MGRASEEAAGKVVVLGTPLRPAVVERLRERFELVDPGGILDPSAIPAAAIPARVLVTLGVRETGPALMDALPALGLIACYGTGFEAIDLDAAATRGIAVTHAPGVTSASVADMAMALLLASVRRVGRGDRLIRAGGWTKSPTQAIPISVGLTGRRVGIFGLGAIGAQVARRATAFEMEVGYHGRSARPDVPYPFFADLTELAAWADVLVVTVRASPANHHSVDRRILEALGPGGHVVNIARGSVIDEAALLAALESGRLGGAGLDVHATEPRPADALARHPDVVLTPHLGGGTVAAQTAAQELLVENLEAFFAGRPVLTPVPRG